MKQNVLCYFLVSPFYSGFLWSAPSDERFNYIPFSGLIHRVEDESFVDMFGAAWRFIEGDGFFGVLQLLAPEVEDSMSLCWFIKLEQDEAEIHYLGASPFSILKCASFGDYTLSKEK